MALEVDEKSLAEFWAEKLGFKLLCAPVAGIDIEKWCFPANAEALSFVHSCQREKLKTYFFDSRLGTSPIIAHLIQEYMEGEGFSHTTSHKTDSDNNYVSYYRTFYPTEETWRVQSGRADDPNKWIASAEAARQALISKEKLR